MFDFQYFAPTRVVFGRGVEARTGQLIRELGVSRVLIHYGGQSAVRSGLLGRIAACLDEADIAHIQLGGVVPNPRLAQLGTVCLPGLPAPVCQVCLQCDEG